MCSSPLLCLRIANSSSIRHERRTEAVYQKWRSNSGRSGHTEHRVHQCEGHQNSIHGLILIGVDCGGLRMIAFEYTCPTHNLQRNHLMVRPPWPMRSTRHRQIGIRRPRDRHRALRGREISKNQYDHQDIPSQKIPNSARHASSSLVEMGFLSLKKKLHPRLKS